MMRHAAKTDQAPQLVDADLAFHLELCRLSANEYLVEHARRILMPLFAFVRIRVIASGQGTSPWGRDLEVHQRIHDLIREVQRNGFRQFLTKEPDS